MSSSDEDQSEGEQPTEGQESTLPNPSNSNPSEPAAEQNPEEEELEEDESKMGCFSFDPDMLKKLKAEDAKKEQ